MSPHSLVLALILAILLTSALGTQVSSPLPLLPADDSSSFPPTIQCFRSPCGSDSPYVEEAHEYFANDRAAQAQLSEVDSAPQPQVTQPPMEIHQPRVLPAVEDNEYVYDEPQVFEEPQPQRKAPTQPEGNVYEYHQAQLGEQAQPQRMPPPPQPELDGYEMHQQQMEQQQRIELENVRRQRMGQLERQRQQVATQELPPLPASATQQEQDELKHDIDALADLLVMLDAVASAPEQQDGPAYPAGGCMQHGGAMEEKESAGEPVGEEVVVVVAGDRFGHAMLIEMHRQIYHADNSPCSHFPSPTEQVQREQQLEALIHPQTRTATPQALQSPEQRAVQLSTSYSMPTAQRVLVAVVLLSALALFAAAAACACVVRHKRRQQSVIIEPPTVEQLGLDVPMLSSSQSAGQVLLL